MAYIPNARPLVRRHNGLGILDITIPTGPLPQTSAADWFYTQAAADLNNTLTPEQLARMGQQAPSLPGLNASSSSNWLLYAAGALLILALLLPTFSRRK